MSPFVLPIALILIGVVAMPLLVWIVFSMVEADDEYYFGPNYRDKYFK